MTAMLPPINFKQWIDDHRDKLKPPVCNSEIYEAGDFIIMAIGGPNSRKDYHDDAGAELFYQIHGDMILRIMENDKPKDIPIREGEMFLLPPHVLHSPQRFKDTVGIVIERKRMPEELDGFLWFCDRCHTKLYEEYVPLKNIVVDLPLIYQHFWENEAHRTCKNCGDILQKP